MLIFSLSFMFGTSYKADPENVSAYKSGLDPFDDAFNDVFELALTLINRKCHR